MFAVKPHIITSIRSKDLSLAGCLSEFIDNSFAPNKGGADTVEITLLPRNRFQVLDNGRGSDITTRLMVLADTSSWGDKSDIGLYGVGATEAQIILGAKTRVHNLRDGKYYSITTDWERESRRKGFAHGEPVEPKPRSPKHAPKELQSNGHGLMIEIVTPWKDRKKFFKLDQLCRQLGITFGPGIRSGMKILIHDFRATDRRRHNCSEVEAFVPPNIAEVVELSGEIAGKSYVGRVGRMEAQIQKCNKIEVGFTHRVIESFSKLRDRSLPTAVFGYIDLSSDWRESLNETKTAITVDKELLQNDIAEKCAELFRKIDEEEKQIITRQFETQLEDLFKTVLSGPGEGETPSSQGGGDGDGGGRGGGDHKTPKEPKDGDGDEEHEDNAMGITVSFTDTGKDLIEQTLTDSNRILVKISDKAFPDQADPVACGRAACVVASSLASYFAVEPASEVRSWMKKAMTRLFPEGWEASEPIERKRKLYTHFMRQVLRESWRKAS